jgi:hypothetical protein
LITHIQPKKMLQQLKSKLFSHGLYLVIIIALAWWILYGQTAFRPPAAALGKPVYVTDTVYLEKPAPAVKLASPPVAPKKLQIYTRPDTARRQAMEAAPIITGIQLGSGQLQVHTISPQGVGQVSTIPVPELPALAITIDSTGQVNVEVDQREVRRQHRRKVWRKIGNGAITVVAFAAGLLL